MFTKNMNQNVQNSTLHNIQLETTQILINSIVQSSAKIFCNRPDNKYLDSAGQEANSSYDCITSISGAKQHCKAIECYITSLLQLLNCHWNVKAATYNMKKNEYGVFQ